MALPTGKTQKGLFHDPEVGTEAHDDLLAWCASKTGTQQIADGVVDANLKQILPEEDIYQTSNSDLRQQPHRLSAAFPFC